MLQFTIGNQVLFFALQCERDKENSAGFFPEIKVEPLRKTEEFKTKTKIENICPIIRLLLFSLLF